MGSKRKLIICITSVLLLTIIVLVMMYYITLNKNEDYATKLISVFDEQETTTVKDVFSFNFERAYIFNDCYISGEGFAKRYNLNISIEQVKSGVSENIQRIVFVDEFGAFVYEFKCDTSELMLPQKSMVIYPETVIEKMSSIQEKPLIINFQSLDYYDS